jgi:hypothetical protein
MQMAKNALQQCEHGYEPVADYLSNQSFCIPFHNIYPFLSYPNLAPGCDCNTTSSLAVFSATLRS